MPALIRKFHEAKKSNNQTISKNVDEAPNQSINQSSNQISVTLWGAGKPKREFLHVSDLAEACVYLMNSIDAEDIYKQDISINELAEFIDGSYRVIGQILID